jgi:hypothetical protein
MLRLVCLLLISLASCLGAATFDPGRQAPQVDPANSTWELILTDLWGSRRTKTNGDLTLWMTIRDGQLVQAMGPSTAFNKGALLLQDHDLRISLADGSFTGTLKMTATPDRWVSTGLTPFVISLTLDGSVRPNPQGSTVTLACSYRASRQDGGQIGAHRSTAVEQMFSGSAHSERQDWSNARWRMGLNPGPEPGAIDRDAIDLHLGLAEGRIAWAAIGITPRGDWPAHRLAPIPVNEAVVQADDSLQFTTTFSERHLHPAGDPQRMMTAAIVANRVLGMTAGHIDLRDGDEKRWASGPGSASPGGGSQPPDSLWGMGLDERPWFTAIPDHRPVESDEHPRLLFRREDLAALRERAKTPLGAAILKRLRETLGNDGRSLPEHFSRIRPANHVRPSKLPLGGFTSWHAAGFGFLYQITGDSHYADLARACVERMFDGAVDFDNRYGWRRLGATMRAGSLLAGMAYAYDFCYEAWDPDFRQRVALEMLDYSGRTPGRKTVTLEHLVGRTGYPPGSNHYGSYLGAGVALLAIQGDPGLDHQRIDRLLGEAESNVSRLLSLGFGDGGMYAEGFHPSRLSSNGGLLEFLHVLKVATGRDYFSAERPNARNITLRWIYHLTGDGRFPNRGVYGGDQLFGKESISNTGDFALGFGAILPEQRSALLWSWSHGAGERQPFNTLRYPHRAIYAFLHWPNGDPENPSETLPKTLVDRDHHYLVTRNRWRDADDIVVTQMREVGPQGYYDMGDDRSSRSNAGTFRIFGHGRQLALSTATGGKPWTGFAQDTDGSVSTRSDPDDNPDLVCIDLSGASGAELVLITLGPNCGPAEGVFEPLHGPGSIIYPVGLGGRPGQVLIFGDTDQQLPKLRIRDGVLSIGTARYQVREGKLSRQGFTDNFNNR